jgi:hypothetical protein
VDLAAIAGYAAVTFIISRAGIFRWLREIGPKSWRDFITCPLCTGFWVGAGLAVFRQLEPYLWKLQGFSGFGSRSAGLALDVVATGALTGAVALLYTSVIDALPVWEPAKLPKISYPDEAPTDPNGFHAPTKRVSDRDIEEARRRMGEKKA